jgi:hypothetical protein
MQALPAFVDFALSDRAHVYDFAPSQADFCLSA